MWFTHNKMASRFTKWRLVTPWFSNNFHSQFRSKSLNTRALLSPRNRGISNKSWWRDRTFLCSNTRHQGKSLRCQRWNNSFNYKESRFKEHSKTLKYHRRKRRSLWGRIWRAIARGKEVRKRLKRFMTLDRWLPMSMILWDSLVGRW
jgi:hypothetical protein